MTDLGVVLLELHLCHQQLSLVVILWVKLSPLDVEPGQLLKL